MPASTSLSSKHHTLIQALLSRGPLKESEFRSIFHRVTGKSPDHQVFNDYISDINDELSYVQLELRKCLNQYDGKAYYGVVNTVSDEHSKLGTKYSVPQIALYKGILEAIVQDTAGEGSISNIDALNIRLENQVLSGVDSQSQDNSTEIPSALKNFSMSQKDKTLEEFVHDQWLCSISDGRIGLGVRSFLDLRSWFHDNEVPTCQVCNEAAVKAEFCQNENCNTRVHQSCLKKLFSLAGVKRVCPGCGTQWRLVAKREATEEQEADDQDGPSENTSQPDPSARKRLRTSKGVDRNTQESDSTITSSTLSGSRRLTRSSARRTAAA
ncbi:unnamed protein product [Coffea canephora]|uniref:Non-structural maintenance of chromosomes element 1 homolog n=1 Tax=Coffea canephora TaxID=49390 RepID=A0A068V808_COFCA|nr:unnamed protein product [Coffea canephora]